MAMSDAELKKLILNFRVSDLQVLLAYSGRNKHGKKNELQKRALELIKLHSPQVEQKVKELQKLRYQQSKPYGDPQEVFPLGPLNPPITSTYANTVNHPGVIRPPNIGNNFPQSQSKPYLNLRQPVLQYAVNPDVKFKELPFFDVLGEILRPSTLMPYHGERFQEREFAFHFTPQQAHKVNRDDDVKVLMRFCLLETSCEQEDNFPSNVCVKVNNRVASLPNFIPTNKPGVDPKRPSRPVEISSLCRLTPTIANDISISWSSNYGQAYVVAVYLVHKLNSAVLINRLKANGVRNPDHTTAMIKEKLCQDRDSEIATMSLRGSLICPLGKIRMKLPCRALTCTHLKCFDAPLYIQMNEKKPKWICPVCDKPAIFKDLAIDGLFLDIATKAPEVCTEVQFHEDGSWTSVMPVQEVQEINDSLIGVTPKREIIKQKESTVVEVISLDSDSDTEDSWPIAQRYFPNVKAPVKPLPVKAAPLMNTVMAADSRPIATVNPNYHSVNPTEGMCEPSTSSSNADMNLLPSTPETMNAGSMDIRPFTPPGIFPDTPTQTVNDRLLSSPMCGTSSGSTNLMNPLSSSQSMAGMSNFDLFSLIHQNQNEQVSFLPIKEPDAYKQAKCSSPDVISIDD